MGGVCFFTEIWGASSRATVVFLFGIASSFLCSGVELKVPVFISRLSLRGLVGLVSLSLLFWYPAH